MKRTFFLIFGIILLIGSVFALSMEQTLKVNIISGDLEVFSPIQDRVYDERQVPINITTGTMVDFFKFNDNGGRFKSLCRNCDEYGFSRLRKKSFRDGFHELTILGVFETGEIVKHVSFTVDSKNPRISKVLPRRNSVTNGDDFFVKFKEDNPVSLTLFHGGLSEIIDIEDKCVLERKFYECNVDVDLTSHNGEEIEYRFEVTDIADNTDSSRTTKVLVDTTLPVVNSFDFSIKRKRADFIFNITEVNFDKITYTDLNDKKPKERILCSRLRDGICEKRKGFKKGAHDLIITVFDDAGNSVVLEEEFVI